MASAIQQLLLAGGSFSFAPVIAADAADYNLTTALTAAGWNGVSPVNAIVTVNSGVALYASSTSTYGFTMGGTFPTGSYIKLVNQGTIYGAGGIGGSGYAYSVWGSVVGTNGSAGGSAIHATHPIVIDNTGGTIAGGGGGGGGGGYCFNNYYYQNFASSGGSGGGGGAGRIVGALGYGVTTGGYSAQSGGNGVAGGYALGGAGGSSTGAYNDWGNNAGPIYGGAGGAGGALGAAGATGGSGTSGEFVGAGMSGGAAGNYAVGNSNVTWLANGTRLGGVS